jgi:hypothetical protein
VASGQLTYADLKTAVLGKRFPASAVASAAQWIHVAYQDVWDAADWSFKRVSRAAFYTSSDATSTGAATATPSMPAAFARAKRIYDDNGDPLVELAEEEFEDTYTGDTSTGRPEAFTVVNRQVILAPTPNQAYLFSLSYWRRVAHKDSSGNVVTGFLSADGDYPLWDDHHRIVVPRAQMVGLMELNDPTWPPLGDEYGRLLESMKSDYVPSPPRRYARWQP